jgi:hypothetical protein
LTCPGPCPSMFHTSLSQPRPGRGPSRGGARAPGGIRYPAGCRPAIGFRAFGACGTDDPANAADPMPAGLSALGVPRKAKGADPAPRPVPTGGKD